MNILQILFTAFADKTVPVADKVCKMWAIHVIFIIWCGGA